MKISIVTVCYNSGAHLADALRSVDSQTWHDREHVVVDGASTDDTAAILAAHADPRRSVVSEPDAGIYDAMNKGLLRASGDVVGFLNADDMLADDEVIAEVARSFIANPDVDLVYGDLNYVAADDLTRVVRRWRAGMFMPSKVRNGWMPPHPTFYARRSMLERVGQFDTRYRIAADYDFMLRCLTQPGVRTHYLKMNMVRMRLGGISNQSISSMLRKSGEDLLIMRRLKVGGFWNLFAKNLRKLPQLFWHH